METSMLAFFGGQEIMWIAIVVLVLFGAKKVPELMKGVGTGIREFKKASKDVQDEMQRVMDEPERTSTPPSSSTPPVRPPSDTISHSPKA
jgi:sec-independent protein translocase protein TatA